MFDALAKRYSTLPSILLKQADSFDIMVYDVAVTWETMQHNKSNKFVDQSMYDEKDLKSILESVKGK